MTVTFRVLGEPAVEVDGELDVPRSGRQRSLIALLAVADGHHVGVDRAIDCLWPDDDRDAARRHLRVLVGELRDRLGAERSLLVTRDGGYALAGVEVDVDRARDALRRGRRLASAGRWFEAAEHLEHGMLEWRGRPFGSLTDERWLHEPARELEHLHGAFVLALCDARLATDRADLALPLLDPAVADDDVSVAVLERHARACARAGRIEDAAASCARAIRAAAEGDREPLQQLQRNVLAGDPATVTPRRIGGPELPRLPLVSSSFIGRDQSLDALHTAIRSGTRAITLLGPGGIGKSRVANELARSMDGAVEASGWIDLTRVGSAAAVPGLLLGALGITGGGDDPLDAIGQAIGSRRLLLVLDNAEHVVEVASVIDGLITRCPRLLLVVTSRTVLDAETLDIQLTPLDTHAAPGHRSSSVQLFLDRAALVDGLVDDSPDTLAAIFQVCAAVDHLPLGIELAAARTALLTPPQVLAGLRRRFDLLRTRDAQRPDRQRSLLDVVEWSYGLADERARRILQSASAFAGGWTLEDVVAVDGSVHDEGMSSGLGDLVAQSLAVREEGADGAPRWRMLDTIAAFARLELDASDDGAERRRRHAGRMLELARMSNTHRPEASGARARLVVELANVHAAIDWALDADPEVAASIYGSLRRYYLTAGSLPEAAEIGVRVLAAVSDPLGPSAAKACFLLGYAQHFLGRPEEAAALLGRARSAFRAVGDECRMAAVDIASADGARFAGDFETARRLVSTAVDTATLHGDRWLAAWGNSTLGFVHLDEANWSEGEDRLTAARDAFDAEGDEFWRLNIDVNVAVQRAILFEDEASSMVLADAVERLADMGHWTYAGYVQALRLRGAIDFDEYDAVLRMAADSLPAIRRTGDRLTLQFATSSLAAGAAIARRPTEAATYGAEATRLAAQTGGYAYVHYALVAVALAARAEGDEDRCATALGLVAEEWFDQTYPLERKLRQRFDELAAGVALRPPPDLPAAIASLADQLPR